MPEGLPGDRFVTLITGASSGIGRALALRMAAHGTPVAVLARRKDLLDSLVLEIERAGGRARAVCCDVTDREAVHEAVREVEASLGPIARLIANAGGATPTGIEPFSAEHVRDVVELNVLGVANCIEAVLPGMLARRSGHLVVTSSLAGYRGLPGAGAYSAAKGAATNLMESLRIDLRPHGIDVSVIAPGFVRTKAGKAKKKSKPLRLELEPAVERMHRAIEARRPFYAFPKTLLALIWLGWIMPASLYDRVLGGRGPRAVN
jgi:NAD(P)-dependent dehydrogenase (short-subunit alcohol dehydrogenase family)